jgi:hypothetical protein
MATYPSTYLQLKDSTEEGVDGLQLDRAVNGSVKARAFFTARKRKWRLKHVLNATDLNALLSFYDTNRTAANTFTWVRDGASYTVLFEGPPQYETLKPGGTTVGLFAVTVNLVQQ